jgi:hypothetical protein
VLVVDMWDSFRGSRLKCLQFSKHFS